MNQSSSQIHVAIVGHTNTGKTSLLRTLTRNRTFGQVADEAGTTRHVEPASCWLDGRPVLTWYDTPGLEDSMSLRDRIDALGRAERLDGLDRIERFLQDPQAKQDFEQESRVLQQVTKSDAVLYVIDAREPVLPKYRDEIYLLAACGKPVIPVLNFTASSAADEQLWVRSLARLGLHLYLRFDTVSPPIDGEALVFRMLAQLLETHRETLQKLAEETSRARARRRRDALALIAGLLVDAAALRDYCESGEQAIAHAVSQQQMAVRAAEQRCVDALLLLFQFGRDDYLSTDLPWSQGSWDTDPFSKEAMVDLGIHLGKGAAAGALAGVAIDVLSAGLSLGTGTLIGAAAGTAWQGLERWGSQIWAKLRGQHTLCVSDEVLLVLAARQLQLLDALEHRGHAAQGPLRARESWSTEALEGERLLKALALPRRHEEWSSIKPGYEEGPTRQRAVQEVADILFSALQHKDS